MAERARVAVLISGRGSNMAALIYAAKAADCPFEIVLVSGDRPDALGLDVAEAEGVKVARLGPPKAGEKARFFDELDAALRKTDAEYVALAGFMRIIPKEFIDRWNGRIVNVHPSLLPKYKGLDTHSQAIGNGDRFGGCSIHIVTSKVDDGPVLGQTEVAILPGDTAETLAERVLIAEHQLYPRALAEFVTRETRPESLLERVRELALELPRAEEKMSHGAPGFRVEGGKFFAYFSHDHHGNGVTSLIVRSSGAEEMESLIEADGELYYRPMYYGASGWIGIRLDVRDNDWDHVRDWLTRSWRAAAPKRLAALPI